MRILLDKNRQVVRFWIRRKILIYGNLSVIRYTKNTVGWRSFYKETHIELYSDGITELTYRSWSYNQRDFWAAGAPPINKKYSHSFDLTDAKFYASKGTETWICMYIYCKCLRLREVKPANSQVFKPQILIKHKENVAICDYHVRMLVLYYLHGAEPVFRKSASQEIPHNSWNFKVHYRVHRIPPLVPTLSQTFPLQTFPTDFFNIYFTTTFLTILTSSN
jgi:hypothetical protein